MKNEKCRLLHNHFTLLAVFSLLLLSSPHSLSAPESEAVATGHEMLQGPTDIGKCLTSGSLEYDPANQVYTI